VWVKKEYRSYKGHKWIWKPNKPKIAQLDSTCFNKPKAYNSEYAHAKGKKIRSRQYSKAISAICVIGENIEASLIVPKRVEQIKLETVANWLKKLGVHQVKCDKRFLGLRRFGIKTSIISKIFLEAR